MWLCLWNNILNDFPIKSPRATTTHQNPFHKDPWPLQEVQMKLQRKNWRRRRESCILLSRKSCPKKVLSDLWLEMKSKLRWSETYSTYFHLFPIVVFYVMISYDFWNQIDIRWGGCWPNLNLDFLTPPQVKRSQVLSKDGEYLDLVDIMLFACHRKQAPTFQGLWMYQGFPQYSHVFNEV